MFKTVSFIHFQYYNFEFKICFGFRYSNFGFYLNDLSVQTESFLWEVSYEKTPRPACR